MYTVSVLLNIHATHTISPTLRGESREGVRM
jgi:hypothetical protein